MVASLAKERLNSLSSDREGGPRCKIQVEKKSPRYSSLYFDFKRNLNSGLNWWF